MAMVTFKTGEALKQAARQVVVPPARETGPGQPMTFLPPLEAMERDEARIVERLSREIQEMPADEAQAIVKQVLAICETKEPRDHNPKLALNFLARWTG